MEWVEPLQNALRSNGGSFIIGVLLLVFGSSAVLSEKTAKEKFGAIGMLARWVQRRKQQAAEQEEELFKRRTDDLWAEIARVDQARKDDKARFQREIKQLRESERLKHKYTVWAAQRVHDLEVWAATNGYVLPTPKILTFFDWVVQDDKESLEEDDDEDD